MTDETKDTPTPRRARSAKEDETRTETSAVCPECDSDHVLHHAGGAISCGNCAATLVEVQDEPVKDDRGRMQPRSHLEKADRSAVATTARGATGTRSF